MSGEDQHIEALDSAPDEAQIGAPNPNGHGNVVVAEVAPGRNGASRKGRAVRPVGAVVEVPQPELPSVVDEADMAYHRQVMQEYQGAQAALQSWMRYCAQKYRLSQGNRIDDAGTIHREAPPEMQAQMTQGPR